MLWKSKFVIQQLKHVTYTSAYEMDDENDEERTVWDIAESLEEENLEMVRQVVKALGQERERARSVLEQTWHVEDQGGLTANVDGNLRRHTPSEVYMWLAGLYKTSVAQRMRNDEFEEDERAQEDEGDGHGEVGEEDTKDAWEATLASEDDSSCLVPEDCIGKTCCIRYFELDDIQDTICDREDEYDAGR